MEEIELEAFLKGSSGSTLAEVVKETLDRLIESDIREKTDLTLGEIRALTLLSAVSRYWREENEKTFAEFLEVITEYYMKLKVSYKRQSRKEVIRFMAKFAEKLREKEEEQKVLRL